MRSSTKVRSPWFYIPTLYFQQGLPVVIVQQLAVILYKGLGVPNDRITLWTSVVAWPWILKMFWSPAIDLHSTKRRWVLCMQFFVLLAVALATASLSAENFLPLSLALFAAAAVFSATHDIALDGYYLLALKPEDQAYFVGVRSTFFRFAMIFGNGVLVMLAGWLERRGMPVTKSWQWAIGAGMGLYLLAWIWALGMMPRIHLDRAVPRSLTEARGDGFREAFRTFIFQRGIFTIVGFFLLYRFSESILTKISPLFLLDSREAGGLALDTFKVGAIQNAGVISLLIGGIAGGVLIARDGLRRWIWPMAIVMNLPNLLYVWAARTQPGIPSMIGITVVEQFAYGFGMASYLVYAMEISRRSKFQTAHYAITAALMALGAMLAGAISGYLEVRYGYFRLFVVICFLSLPGMALIRFLPMKEAS